ncbi:hypothetical protein [Polycyclovorans algicola]|uniref:hypothetical protein n=1 Tax=Polycyclovorans algicola TaxID=616992 RepID=UPI00126902DF|nr:hypothetical protein [Polycyclovorans algicola]
MATPQPDPLEPLVRQLGVPRRDLGFLDALNAAACAQLVADIERAKGLHAAALGEAMEGALNQLPRLLRLPVRKLFGL